MEHIVQKILKKLNKDYDYIVKKKRGSSPEIKLGDFLLAIIRWVRVKDTCTELNIGYQTFNRLINKEFPDVKLTGGGETWSYYFLSLAHYKRCFKCGTIKEFSDFYNTNSISHCKSCHSIKNKNYRNKIKDNFESVKIVNQNTKVDTKCVLQYSKEYILKCIIQFHRENNRIPTTTDFSYNNKFPSFKTVQKYFGSWNAAIEAAGFEPNIQNGFGIDTYGLDGHLYRSQAEAYFSDNFLFGKYEYIVEPKYPNKKWLYDWYVVDLDLYIELDGGLRPERIKEKIKLNKQLGRKLLVIPTNKLQDVAPLSQQVEEENLKFFQCRFESDRGYENQGIE